jgi:hypothetical protein
VCTSRVGTEVGSAAVNVPDPPRNNVRLSRADRLDRRATFCANALPRPRAIGLTGWDGWPLPPDDMAGARAKLRRSGENEVQYCVHVGGLHEQEQARQHRPLEEPDAPEEFERQVKECTGDENDVTQLVDPDQ